MADRTILTVVRAYFQELQTLQMFVRYHVLHLTCKNFEINVCSHICFVSILIFQFVLIVMYIEQGRLGDCWFLSAVAVLAEVSRISEVIITPDYNEEGIYTVRFCVQVISIYNQIYISFLLFISFSCCNGIDNIFQINGI